MTFFKIVFSIAITTFVAAVWYAIAVVAGPLPIFLWWCLTIGCASVEAMLVYAVWMGFSDD